MTATPDHRNEMRGVAGVRPAWRELAALLDVLGPDGLRERQQQLARSLEDDGAAYRPHGTDAEQPWRLDPIPLLLDQDDWSVLEAGVQQRALLLDLVLADLYGPRRLIADRLVPPEVVLGHAGFLREVDQAGARSRHPLLLTATDLGRDGDGRWTVLADRTQAPSGAGYAMENRHAVSGALPGLYRTTPVQRLGPFFAALRGRLQHLAPHDAARVVLLTPGAHSETAFDQAFLSTLLGLPLVEGPDLTVRDGRVWQRSVGRMQPVDVILRRVDDSWCDPLELRPDSQLGVPGLVEAARLGNVAVVNPLGSGVLENPGLFPFLPAVCRALLDADLLLPGAATWWCGDPVARAHVLEHLEHLVIKPIGRAVAGNSRFGWELDRAGREAMRRRITAEPHAWVGQQPVPLGTAPTLAAPIATAGSVQARPVTLRLFAVAGDDGYLVMPGALARVAADGGLRVSNQHGAVSKDVWVLSASAAPVDEVWSGGVRPPEAVIAAVPPRVAEDLFWFGRHVERAEALTRLLRITDNRWHDVRPEGDAAMARCLVVLLEALTAVSGAWPGFAGDGAARRLAAPREELLSLIADDSRAGTLAHSVRRMRDTAAAVRDQLSNDTWMVLSGLDRTLAAVRPGPDRPAPEEVSATLSRVLESLLAVAGVAAESMMRDTGWWFLDAGRRLERAQHLVGLLGSTLASTQPPAVEDLVIESVLVAAESIVTHRRRYPAGAGVDTVLELLLTDRDNPRSVAHQLTRLRSAFALLPGDDDTLSESVETLLARLSASDLGTLAADDGHDRRPALASLLADVGAGLRTLADTVTATHFVQPALPRSFDAMLESV